MYSVLNTLSEYTYTFTYQKTLLSTIFLQDRRKPSVYPYVANCF